MDKFLKFFGGGKKDDEPATDKSKKVNPVVKVQANINNNQNNSNNNLINNQNQNFRNSVSNSQSQSSQMLNSDKSLGQSQNLNINNIQVNNSFNMMGSNDVKSPLIPQQINHLTQTIQETQLNNNINQISNNEVTIVNTYERKKGGEEFYFQKYLPEFSKLQLVMIS